MSLGHAAYKSLAIDGDVDALVAAAHIHMLDGRPSSALPLLTRALTLRPTNAAVLGLRSLARERCGLTASATSDARAMVLLQPRMSGGYVRLASVCLAANDYPSAACVAFRGMRCGDTHRNGELAAIMAKARAQGRLPPVPWTPVGWAEAAMWRLRSLRAGFYWGWLTAAGWLQRGPLRLLLLLP
eukprot:TRINITY_DN10468_c0_g1_i1.p1 TRINITY_DN10468_c0_g1~~TRINITY_DN10468_c0_g1_i1.p1  ORF type:complete len:185 (-),score=14.08 TRINITY_DN10468_c0_g1_i1:133-687(-)